jgi:predicted HTH transcriptional regulator
MTIQEFTELLKNLPKECEWVKFNWLATRLNPRIDFNIFEFDVDEKHFVLFRVPATRNMPVSFKGE